MKRTLLAAFAAVAVTFAGTIQVNAQIEASDPVVNTSAAHQAKTPAPSTFHQALWGAGVAGFLDWCSLFASFGFMIYLCVTLGILIRPSKIMPASLVNSVTIAMKEGDVVKAIQFCENEPVPMAKILTAGLSHVEEGFEVIQEAISTASDLETEKLNQQLNWLSVNANIAPMLGLLGTVIGMIAAFKGLTSGEVDIGYLAGAISMSLWTTAFGLCIAIPSVCSYYAFRNKSNRIVIQMEATTMELIKDLRNVEVVTE